MIKLRKVKITSDGRLTKTIFSDTGEEVPFVQRIKFEHALYGEPIVYIEQAFQLETFDIEGFSPDAMTVSEAKAQ
ncbi:hypothetical protein H8A99_03725 [Bradyrhizobium sp. Arg68]|uniref:hypothetical protein n=1 Tax=Bradyrhizobium ivorense TaxID=2511166 RepID=UPI001E5D38BC|nr:hypothetical protein [Bradyrhizobium ivorense]MCC8935626.1 hypothetical protein [Bradyrhizobium ivorense]